MKSSSDPELENVIRKGFLNGCFLFIVGMAITGTAVVAWLILRTVGVIK